MKTIEINLYKFSELSETAKQNAIDKLHDTNIDHNWWEFIEEDFINESLFEVTDIYFSHFYRQGEGAMFEYSGIKDELKENIINSLELPEWKKRVIKNYIIINCKGKHSGHYHHYNSVNHIIDIESDNGAQYYENIENLISIVSNEIENKIIEAYNQEAKNLLKSLLESYEYLTSNEAIIETIEANDYDFTEEGEIY